MQPLANLQEGGGKKGRKKTAAAEAKGVDGRMGFIANLKKVRRPTSNCCVARGRRVATRDKRLAASFQHAAEVAFSSFLSAWTA